ncbi:DUF3427 domain-containing protein [Grimontia sp. NTOU-MAR1]|uniref:DUF3427 domain-containing protein n=1 Tax=Grimontia sp. NTOU-MAR1 TaxID=3111011 RepID=UPI002DBF153B|nr:DUF3427 domain-containing protein [Grimontia sp. NTOU-MAR1]WRV99280.1 DUF3427 domain-containing protein [Grimontia sp. NTOU-MAR1]
MKSIEFDKAGRIKRLNTLAKPLNANHIESACRLFNEKQGDIESYAPSKDYDLIVHGRPYPPKAIFGLAMSELLNIEVSSKHFTGGEKSPCFKVLRKLGYEVIAKERDMENVTLELYGQYNREEVCKVFAPEAKFTKGAGSWGLSGIVSNASKEGDFVFFVTLEPSQSNTYEDFITDDGKLIWWSQNQHTPESSVIKQLIAHDDKTNTIHLFLRANKEDDYTYLGHLLFDNWDTTTSEPVNINWQFESWPIPSMIQRRIAFETHSDTPTFTSLNPDKTVIKEVPIDGNLSPFYAESGRKRKAAQVDWAERDKRNRELGDIGEQIVLEMERKHLVSSGKPELAERIQHMALINPNAGYDILSFEPDGTEKFIEVKTTEGRQNTQFFISDNEVSVSRDTPEKYWLYRLYNLNRTENTADYYKRKGAIDELFDLRPTSYRASLK